MRQPQICSNVLSTIKPNGSCSTAATGFICAAKFAFSFNFITIRNTTFVLYILHYCWIGIILYVYSVHSSRCKNLDTKLGYHRLAVENEIVFIRSAKFGQCSCCMNYNQTQWDIIIVASEWTNAWKKVRLKFSSESIQRKWQGKKFEATIDRKLRHILTHFVEKVENRWEERMEKKFNCLLLLRCKLNTVWTGMNTMFYL